MIKVPKRYVTVAWNAEHQRLECRTPATLPPLLASSQPWGEGSHSAFARRGSEVGSLAIVKTETASYYVRGKPTVTRKCTVTQRHSV